MKKARFDFLAVCLASSLVAGCAGRPIQPAHVADLRYRPNNYWPKTGLLDPQIKRVAILPVTSVSATEAFSAGAELLQKFLDPELEKTKRFDLVVVSPEQLRLWTGRSAWRADEELPADFFKRIKDGCACDGVFFAQLTRYQPYLPVAVGWKLCLVKVEGGQIAWAADEVLDAGDAVVANAARQYSGQHAHIDGPLDDPDAILGSPSRFGQYSLSALLATLPPR